jgi:O-antigen/teichoic acid export membrane protein
LAVTLLAVVPIALIAPLTTARGLLLALGGMSRTLVTQLVSLGVRLVGTVAVALGPRDLTRVVLVLLLVSLAEYVVCVWVALRRVHRDLGGPVWTADLTPMRGRAREVLRFTVYVDASSLISAVVKQADVLILGVLGGSVAAGQYRLGKQISAGAASLAGSLQAWLYPRLATASGLGDEDQFRQLLRRATWLLGVPGAVMTAASLPLLPWFVTLTAGDQFSAAVVPAQLLTAGAALSTLFLVFRPAYLAAGHVRTFLTIVTMTSSACLVGFVVAGEAWGADGVAVVRLVVVSVVGNLVGALYLRHWARHRTLLAGRAVSPLATDQGIRETDT